LALKEFSVKNWCQKECSVKNWCKKVEN